uniref:Chitin-binding type-2 domain-containing protein n=1 Tax=Musca domestica TaxID=7370 RepID=A0A1I8MSR0_MUSDO
MRTYLLALAVVTALAAISSAADEECVQRKLRGLALHWPNPRDCYSFYRCTNKDVKREIACPAGRQYNRRTGKCAPVGRKVCRLSLLAPLQEADNPCSGEISGTYLADPKSCRSFNICNANLAYPQTCNPGSYFDSAKSACVPDTDTTCWENLCLSKANGVYVANENDCYGFYVCADKTAVKQACPSGSYFNKDSLNCVPGVCPSDVVVTTPCPEVTTTTKPAVVTTPCAGQTTTTKVVETTTSCSEKTTTPTVVETTTSCSEKTTTPKVVETTTSCSEKTTTPKVVETTTSCSEKTTTPNVVETTTPKVVETTTPKVVETTTSCSEKTTTPKVVETTTPKVVETTTPKVVETTTPCIQGDCSANNCDQTSCLNAENHIAFPAKNDKTQYCVCMNKQAICRVCPEGSEFDSQINVCKPIVVTTTPCPTTTLATTTASVVVTTTPCLQGDCSANNCDQTSCLNAENHIAFPAKNDKTQYCVCMNKQAICRVCPEGSEFNGQLNVCMPKELTTACPEAAKHASVKCAGGYEEGDLIMHPKNRQLFYICFDGKFFETSCGEGNYYNAEEKSCMPDYEPKQSRSKRSVMKHEEHICPGGLQNFESVAHPLDCNRKLVCRDGRMIEESCERGYYFNEAVKACIKDVNNICPLSSRAASTTCVDGTFKVNDKDCTAYFRCCTNTWKEANCAEGEYFNPKNLQCEKDEKYYCLPPPVVPCVEGKQYQDPANCSAYFLCCSGELVSKSCETGYYFNGKECELDVNNQCWPKDVETCSDGELRPDDDNCAAYYKCCSNGWVAEVCPDNEYFNWETEACEFDAEHECREAAPCKTGEKYADPENCSAYYECCGGVFKPQYCEAGYLYASAEAECVLDTKNECWTDEEDDNGCNTDCPGGYKNGTFVEGDDCDTFYICVNGELQLQSCGYGMYYNNVSRSCVADTDRTCWTNVCADEKNGVYLPVPKHCSMFYECMNGQSNALYCEEGDYFNPDTSACEPDLNAVCYNPCAEVDKVMTLPHPNCNQYYWCNDKTTLVGTCPLGGFNASLGSCDASTSCSNYKCNGVPNYVPFPDEKDKTLYYICINGVAVEKQCLPNQEFNGFACQYVSSPDCNATLCDTLQPYESFPTINGSETEFCMCIKGLAQKESCPTDYVFNETMKMCASNIPCNSMICKTNDNYYTFANNDDPATFCICINNVAVVADCPAKQTYNPYIDACTELVYSSDCDQTVCLKEDDSYTYAPKNESLNGICECKSNVGIFVECPPDTVFDSFLNICKLIDINCQSSKCVGAEDNTVFPALTTDEGYCQCQKGVAVYQNCLASESFNDTVLKCVPSLCDRSKCADQPPNVGYPATDNKYGFCMCDESGSSTFRPCPNDTEFSSVTNACKVPLQNCADTECVGVADNTKVPALSTVHGYCLCQGGKPTFEECLNNWVFDSVSQICEAPKVAIEDVCDMNYCNLPGNALKKYPSYSNIYGFCQCSAAGPSFEFCQAGYIFNEYSLVCVPSAESMCDIALCADATPESPYGIPAKTSNTAFCLCSGPDSIMVLNCADGKFFDKTLGYCVSKLEQGCGCPDGMKTGDRAPNAEDCTQYYECQSGSMQLKSCPAGQYFNTNTNCCLNNDGTCDANTACTCLGLYREGERIIHPHNMQLYFVCEKNNLHERNCGSGRIFNKAINQCMQATQAATFSKHFMRKRSADIEEFPCLANEKRSVPSNCSQYELCINETWQRQTCPNSYYYNPEQQKCLEPRDDTVCEYAKASNLPPCNAKNEQRLHRGRTCQQYFRCQNSKWHLNNCGKALYYDEAYGTCLPHNMGQKFECTQLENKTQGQQVIATESCHHLAVRSYDENCAMYLMCLEDQWWYHYCPLGMYFNGSLNYCIPDTENVCPQAIKKKDVLEIENFALEPCPQEGLLRPSALACNRFYICIAGRWQQQQCTQAGQYYDAEASKCARDTEGICTQLQMDCVPQERRSFPLNCSAYEECSTSGKWEKRICGRDEMYDDLLGGCIRNDGICSARGLKRVCNGQELRWVPGNCSLFYYCLRDSWALGSCVRGHMFSPKEGKCVPHSLLDKCKTLGELGVQQLTEQVHLAEQTQVCENQPEGASVIHSGDCSRYYICVTPTKPYEMQCVMGSFFDPQLGYCRPNDGSCRLPLTGECANATDGSLVAHPTNCQAYYSCSTLTGQQLLYCPEGQYYHKFTRQCRADHGECKGAVTNENSKCANASHGTRLAHERYCNVYYACVRGLAIPIECPEQYQFNALLGKCLYDATGQCQDGHLEDTNQTTYSCGTLPDGSYLPDRKDCTRYYICSEGQAQPKKCSGSTYFDSQQLLCVPDDGSCPFVDEDAPNQHPVPPDPIVCEGKHGYIMADPLNCNNFYVCLDGKLRHERCYDQHFFNTTSNQCQKKPLESALDEEAVTEPLAGNLLKSQPLRQQQQCTDNSTSVEQMCKEYSDGTTIAQQGDCRYFITCQPEDEAPLLQKCRNGESYDSLLGFCRQNDGTCLLENGKRVGECNDRHGQMTRDPNNCRQYFTCINGQKIPQTCGEHEYFSKSLNACVNDTANTCNPEQQQQLAEEPQKQTMQQSCVGLSEGMLYPYVADNCRSYFQCVKGVAEIHQCADGLYFDVAAIKCVKEIEECTMAPKSMQRTLQLKQKTYDQLCLNRKPDTTYAHTENKCKSYYTCGARGEITHALCPLGMAFDGRAQRCLPENQVICM